MWNYQQIRDQQPNIVKHAPKVMGAYDSHEALKKYLISQKPCKILDVASGQGVAADFLLKNHWDVHCSDLNPENFRLRGVPCKEINLNYPLLYPSSSFDAILFANTIHRIFNPGGAIHEFYRILKPGGQLYINAKNNSNIVHRVRYLLYGGHRYVRPAGIDCLGPESGVRIRITFPEIVGHLNDAGFQVIKLLPTSIRPLHKRFTPIAWLIRFIASFIPKEKRKKNFLDIANSPDIISGGHYVTIIALKPHVSL